MSSSAAAVACGRALGALTLGAPALAWGLLGCAVPVILHLLLRRRPRPLVFPAARLLLPYRSADLRAQRLRYLLLLACRAGLIALVAAALMRVACESAAGPTGATPPPAGEPVSAVFCLDDSASMGYRFQGRPRISHAAAWARTLLADASRWPPGSEVAVVTGGDVAAPPALTADLRAADRRIEEARAGAGDRGVADLLRAAYAALSGSQNHYKEVYLLTDLARHAWRDDPPPLPETVRAVRVLDAGGPENRSAFLSWPDPPDGPLPLDTPGEIAVRARAGDPPLAGLIELRVDGQPRGQQAIHVPADAERRAAIPLPAMTAGPHAVGVSLRPPDPLEADNQRFCWVTVAPPEPVVIVADDPADEVAALIGAMIAPAGIEPARRRYARRDCTPAGLPGCDLAGVSAIVLADVAALDEPAWRVLGSHVAAGGWLLVVPGPRTTPRSLAAAGSLLPAEIRAVADCPEPVTLAATDWSHPWLRPFADTSIDSINDRPVYRRLELATPRAGAAVVAPFSDGPPAIVSFRHGQGDVVMLAFSPARPWSRFGSQAAPMIVLLHTMLSDRSAASSRVELLTAGRLETRRAPAGGSGPTWIIGPGDAPAAELPDRGGFLTLPTAMPGHYRLARPGPAGPEPLHYAVNVAESESDPARLTREEVLARFPPGKAVVLQPGDPTAAGSGTSARRDWTGPLAFALLALLIAETFYSNRFYGRPAP